MTVIVLGGGNSPERPISLRSAASVAGALRQAGFETIEADPEHGLAILEEIHDTTIVFPVLHGAGGEDGIIQAELEHRRIPYLGTESSASRVCFDKWQTREMLQVAKIAVATGEKVSCDSYAYCSLIHQPHVVKAAGGGSSIGTLIVRDPLQKVEATQLAQVFQVSDQAVVEELVEGVEITIPILDSVALAVIEIKPPHDGEFDYENKYNGKTEELCPPVSIDEPLLQKAQRLAEQVHKTLGARHMSRVDMIVRPNGDLVVLEINTIPGMTDQSLYPKSATATGIPFPALMKKFVKLVVRDYDLQRV